MNLKSEIKSLPRFGPLIDKKHRQHMHDSLLKGSKHTENECVEKTALERMPWSVSLVDNCAQSYEDSM